MKINTRRNCKKLSAQACFLRKNSAIPEESYSDDKMEQLGRKVMYEAALIHSPVLVSTRLQDKANKVRLSRKYMTKMNDLMDDLMVQKLTDSISALQLSDEGTSELHTVTPTETKSSDREEEEKLESSSASDDGQISEIDAEPPRAALGRIEVKVVDSITNEEVVVSRCVRFMDTEQVEI